MLTVGLDRFPRAPMIMITSMQRLLLTVAVSLPFVALVALAQGPAGAPQGAAAGPDAAATDQAPGGARGGPGGPAGPGGPGGPGGPAAGGARGGPPAAGGRGGAPAGGGRGGGGRVAPFSAGGAAVVSAANLKVLTAENVEFTMQNITFALGLKCIDCHDVTDLSLDTKPQKVKARMMLDMVRDINAKFGDGKTHVTCWTCHRGSTERQVARPSTK